MTHGLQSPSKNSLDEADCIHLVRLCAEVHLQCRTCITILESNANHSTQSPIAPLRKLLTLLDTRFIEQLKALYSYAGEVDYKEIRANGIRSFLLIVTRCLTSLLAYIRNIRSHSSRWSTPNQHHDLCAFVDCFGELCQCINLLKYFPRFCSPGSVFPRRELLVADQLSSDVLSDTDDVGSQNNGVSCVITAEEDVLFRNLQTRFDRIEQAPFYGRCLGFYFCPSAQRILSIMGSFMAGYGNTFLESKQGISNLVFTVVRSVSSFLSPEERGQVLAHLTRNANVDFCKAFWSFAEHPVLTEGPNVLLPPLTVNHTFDLLPRKLFIPTQQRSNVNDSFDESTVNSPKLNFIVVTNSTAYSGPSPLPVRLLSFRSRPGMEWAHRNLLSSILQSTRWTSKPTDLAVTDPAIHEDTDWVNQSLSTTATELRSYASMGTMLSVDGQSSPTSPNSTPTSKLPHSVSTAELHRTNTLSPCLLFHIHGGGFVALSTQTQDTFLRPWAKYLDCPIFSVDYSLSPGAPFPRAVEECFFAYCWVTLNREKLGCQSDARIILCGDSAGGNLVLSLCLKIAQCQLLHKPAGAFVAYAPTLVSFAPTPARMLSLSDPLLPIGILSRCILAYAGVDEATLNSANPNPTSTNPKSSRSSSTLGDFIWSRFFPPKQPLDNHTHSASPGQLRRPRGSSAVDRKLSRGCESAPPHDFVLSSNGRSTSCVFTLSSSDDDDESPMAIITPPTATDGRDPPSDLDRFRDLPIHQDPLMSPNLASDDQLKQLPPLAIVVSNFDPFLDDCVDLAKRSSALGVSVDFRVLDDLPHAFLNFAPFGEEFQHANQVCMEMIGTLCSPPSGGPSVVNGSDPFGNEATGIYL